MCKISVIIPVYNMERYLRECLDSVICQTMEDIEIVCVNDGSTDSSGKILDEYAERDGRIKVIHKANSGYGDSVNVGLDSSTGEFIGIVEPDDYIAHDMYEMLYSLADKESLDFVKGNFVEFYGEERKKTYKPVSIIEDKSFYNEIFKPIDRQGIFRGYIMNPSGIYRRTFLAQNEIRHNTTPGASYQDIGFWFQVMVRAKRARLIDKNVYYYRQDNMASSMNNRSKVFCICEEYNFLQTKLDERDRHDEKIAECYTYCMFSSYFNTIGRIAVEWREDFARRFATDFYKLKEDSLYSTKFMAVSEKEYLQYILDDTDGYIERLKKPAEYFKKEMEKYHNAIIYGAGTYGKRVFRELYQEDLGKVIGYAVTECGNQPTHINGISVKQIEDYLNDRETLVVILGVSDRYKKSVYQQLRQLEFKNIIEPNL